MKTPNSISLKFPVITSREGWQPCSFFLDDRIEGITYHEGTKATKSLRAGLEKQINQGLDQLKHSEQRIIGTSQDVVFLCQYKHGSFEYVICGIDRKNGSVVIGNWKNLNEVVEAAKDHINSTQNFGEIIWEHTI